MEKNIIDDLGYNQIWHASKAMEIRTERRCDYMVSQMSSDTDNARILEIGCGTGEISHLLSKKTSAKVLGTDLCVPFIDQAKRNYLSENLRYDVLDFNDFEKVNLITHGEKFDYVVGNGILHHLYHDLDNALANINRLLKPGGKMIFMEPNIVNPYCFLIFTFPVFRKLAKLDPLEMAFTKGFITQKLEATGFKDIVVRYKDFLVPGTPSFLIKPLISMGNIIEKIPLANRLAQSIYVTATKN